MTLARLSLDARSPGGASGARKQRMDTMRLEAEICKLRRADKVFAYVRVADRTEVGKVGEMDELGVELPNWAHRRVCSCKRHLNSAAVQVNPNASWHGKRFRGAGNSNKQTRFPINRESQFFIGSKWSKTNERKGELIYGRTLSAL